MKFYILDDDISVVKMVEEIVKDSALGEIVGRQTDSLKALEECAVLKPDVLLMDLLMPDLDGITFMERIKKVLPSLKCVMISQVSSKKMVGEAYDGGITFFVNKPINRKEVRHVLNNIAEGYRLETTLAQIKAVVGHAGQMPAVESNHEKKYRIIFSRLGILGESGCDEIYKCCMYLQSSAVEDKSPKLMEMTQAIFDNPKAAEQRIRRAISKGLSNIATLGVEDYLNDVFVKYSNTLYDFEQVRIEMENIRGKSPHKGKINIKKFLDNLMVIVEETQ
ncbi:response regulator [Fusibacter sp. JL298sf-3]